MSTGSIIFFVIAAVVVLIVIVSTKSAKKRKNRLDELLKGVINKHSLNLKKIHKSMDNKLLISFDESKKKLVLVNRNDVAITIDFDLIIDCVVNINGETISKSSATNIIGGAILAGGIGALIGSTMKSKSKKEIDYVGLRLTLNNLEHPMVDLCFQQGQYSEVETDNVIEWHSVFKVIIERNSKPT